MSKWVRLQILTAVAALAGEKLTIEDRIEISRGMNAEYATSKIVLPRSKKPLVFNSDGTWDKAAWQETNKQLGPAARVGDLIQITKVDIEAEKIVFEINHGMKGNKKWYERIEVGMGGNTSPVSQQGDSNAASGTVIALHFGGKPVPPLKASEIKKMMAAILDFEKHSATEAYVDTLPPEIKEAISKKTAVEAMDREQVMLALWQAPQQDARNRRRLRPGRLDLWRAARQDHVCHLPRQQGIQGPRRLCRHGRLHRS